LLSIQVAEKYIKIYTYSWKRWCARGVVLVGFSRSWWWWWHRYSA